MSSRKTTKPVEVVFTQETEYLGELRPVGFKTTMSRAQLKFLADRKRAEPAASKGAKK